MEHTYSPKNFSKLVGVSVFTLQRWDRNGTLTAHRTPTNRRYYTHDQYLQYRGLISNEQGKTIAYARVSSPLLTPMYNCARIKLTVPRYGGRLRGIQLKNFA